MRFARLLTELGETGSTREKTDLLVNYFRAASASDLAWTLGLFTGRKLKRQIRTRQLAEWLTEWRGIPGWLFEESYHHVGDLAETLSLLDASNDVGTPEGDLSDFMSRLQEMPQLTDEQKGTWIRDTWSRMDKSQKFVFNKLLTGGFRVGVSAQLVIQALAKVYETEPAVIAHRISGDWDPSRTDADAMLRGVGRSFDLSRPYPFFLAHALPQPPGVESLGPASDWLVEWKYDGIRAQVVRRAGQTWVWSRGEELVTERFPEVVAQAQALPEGTVLDGEVLVWLPGQDRPASFHLLQQRIARKQLTKRVLAEAPVRFLAYDLLEQDGVDLRGQPQQARRERLQALLAESPVAMSPEVLPAVPESDDWAALAPLR